MSILTAPSPATLSVLAPYQGLWRGAVFGEGTEWLLDDNLVGLLDYNSRVADQPIPRADGEILAGLWASGRAVTLPFLVLGDGVHSAQRQSWLATFAPAAGPYSQEWLAFRVADRIHLVRGRMVRRALETSPLTGRAFRSRGMVEFKLTDPRVYDGVRGLQSVVVTLGAAVGGGFDLPVEELPIEMTEGEGGGTTVAVNLGSVNAHPAIRVRNVGGSNITEFELTNATLGITVHMVVEIAPGQTLRLDFDNMATAAPGPHIHIDGNSRFGGWQHPRVPLVLRPGNNQLLGSFDGGVPEVRVDWLESIL